MTAKQQPRPSKAFTLIELIVVITIIVLVLAVILPVVNTLNANRGLANAQNQIAAYISTARGDAIQYQRPMGVCFYLDPVNQQCTMVEVEPIQLLRGLSGSNVNQPPVWDSEWFPDMNTPIDIAGDRITVSKASGTGGSLTPYREPFTLSKAIGVAVENSPVSTLLVPNSAFDTTGANTTSKSVDRLRRLGVIMFSPTGNIVPMTYGIPLGNSGAITTVPIPNSLGAKVMYGQASFLSGFNTSTGIILYDHDQYIAQTTTAGNKYTDGDRAFTPSWTTTPSTADKTDEENWIYSNGLSLTINPFDGTLMKAK